MLLPGTVNANRMHNLGSGSKIKMRYDLLFSKQVKVIYQCSGYGRFVYPESEIFHIANFSHT
jgi:hypothetical protein